MKDNNLVPFATVGLLIIYFSVAYFVAEKKDEAMDFSGVIEHIRYSDKGFAFVKIKDKEIYLGNNNWTLLKGNIHVGDSIIKKKGELSIKVYDIMTKEYKVYQ